HAVHLGPVVRDEGPQRIERGGLGARIGERHDGIMPERAGTWRGTPNALTGRGQVAKLAGLSPGTPVTPLEERLSCMRFFGQAASSTAPKKATACAWS